MKKTILPTSASGRKSYKDLMSLIKNQINSGELKVHDRLPTMQKICDQYEISPATVNRALSELYKESVLYSEKGNGIFVSPIHKVSMKIGVICGKEILTNSMYNTLIQVLQYNALADEKSVTLFHLRKQKNRHLFYVDEQNIIDHEIDALFLINIVNLGLISSLKKIGIPIIATDLDATDIGVHSIYFDNELSGFDLTQRLLQDGHRNIWFVGGVAPNHDKYDLCLRQRYTGYKLACRGAGVKPGVEIFMKDHSTHNLKKSFVEALETYEAPTAIVGEYSEIVNNCCHEFGLTNVEMAGWSNNLEIFSKKCDLIKYMAKCDFEDLAELSYNILQKIDQGDKSIMLKSVIESEILSA
ncbi:MAG: hypothetical protein COA79_01730 [Planctomycetota bacterium]|nr:MAG: hypothetical protein COA79_01730 [Planctomycetota bacterium]